MGKRLGEFEQMILLALVRQGEEAYGASIRREIVDRSGREASAGAVYTVLERLESAGMVTSFTGEPTSERGGRRRKHYRVTRDGARLLHDAQESMNRMAEGLDARLARLAETAEEGA